MTETEIEVLKTALKWYMDMYGCSPQRNEYDGDVEYSCNGYITTKEDAVALSEAKKMLNWFEKIRRMKMKVGELKQGEHFVYCGEEFVKLDDAYGGCLCLASDVLWEGVCFDDNNGNNWATSTLRERLKWWLIDDNLIPFVRDLTTDDGMTDYGTCMDIVSMLTCGEYRKYRKFIPNCGNGYWTITADSLKYCARLVLSDGSLACDSTYYSDNYGVRPLCVLKSDTEVYKNEE